MELRATTELLQMDSPELAAYLRSYGGLPERDAMLPGAPIGPLSASQVGALSCMCAVLGPALPGRRLHSSSALKVAAATR